MQYAFCVRFITRFHRAVFAPALIAGATLAVSASAFAATFTYPGIAPCDTTLQACIDGVGSDNTIELAFDTTNGETLSIQNKNLVLQPKSGNTPKLGYVGIVADTAATTVVLQNLPGIGSVDAFCGKADLNISVLGNTFTPGNTLTVRDNPGYSTGQITATIARNSFNISNVANGYDAIAVTVFMQSFNVSIVDNDLALTNLTQNGGIQVYVGGGNGNIVTIDRNRLVGSNFDYGIQLRMAGGNDSAAPASLLNATVTNNLIAGQFGNTGAPGGIVGYAGGWNGTIDAKVINNTVVDGRTGIFFGVRDDMGSAALVAVDNNIVAYNQNYAIGLDAAVVQVVSNNLIFGNGSDYDGPVPGTIIADPLFVNRAAKNYALASGSPAIDRGLDAVLPAQFTLDAAGNARRVGTIDIGAYESAAIVAPAAGVCGADNGLAFTHASPPMRLCGAGLATVLLGSGPWTWSCVGTGANATVNCGASLMQASPAPVSSPLWLGLLGGALVVLAWSRRRAQP